MTLFIIWIILTLILFVPYYIIFKCIDAHKKREQDKYPTLEQMTKMPQDELRKFYEDNDD